MTVLSSVRAAHLPTKRVLTGSGRLRVERPCPGLRVKEAVVSSIRLPMCATPTRARDSPAASTQGHERVRLGHAGEGITLETHSHVIRAMHEEAAATVAGFIFEGRREESEDHSQRS
jgi:hypothetical protein